MRDFADAEQKKLENELKGRSLEIGFVLRKLKLGKLRLGLNWKR